MKNFLSLIAAGVIGGFMVFTLMNGTNKSNITPIGQPLVQQVGFNSGGPFDFSDAAEKATKCVVHIQAGESESLAQQRRNEQKQNNPFGDLFDNDMFFGSPFGQPRKKQGTGSGVIISSDGYIVTNNHVVGFADDIMITLSNDKTYKGKVIGTDPNSDLAVVKIEADNLPTLDYANSDLAKVGEWVLAVGNPFDYLTSTVTAGIISAKGRDINIIKEYKAIEEFIQTDAAINPGNSGGALVDAQGKLLGINTAIASRTGYYNGYSFAIPVNLMTKIVDDIIEFGSYQRANLGVYINDLDEQYMKDLQLDTKDGVVITELIDGGAAQFAGLRTNDVIVGLNGKAVRSSKELVEGISLSRIDDVLDLDIIRDRRKKKVPVRLRKGL